MSELGLTVLRSMKTLPERYSAYLSVEELHYDAWLIFWGTAFILYFAEHRFRSYYLRNDKTTPVSPLLSLIFRTAVLSGVILWIAKYVLDWHGTHIMISATAITVVSGMALKGISRDLFAGISLHLSQAVIPSQWIRVPKLFVDGEIITTNWRETRLRTTGGHIYIIPNSVLARSHFHNMSWPDTRRRHALDFIVSSHNNPEEVEKALLQAVEGIPGVLFSPKPPQAIIKAYREFGIHYQLRVWSDTYYDPSSLENGIYKSAWKELKKHEIRFLNLSDELALRQKSEKNR
ncbi:MAG: mechanosensitive ion channel family protein [bacterium]|nr:mechanosensitive ion channel family protein [bacterium]